MGGELEKTAPFSVRLTEAERRRLEAAASGVPLGSYIRARLLDAPAVVNRGRGRFPVKDHQILGQLLGELGRSRLASNLNQLARAANSGSLPVTPETQAALNEACEDVRWMRQALMQAMGLLPGARP